MAKRVDVSMADDPHQIARTHDGVVLGNFLHLVTADDLASRRKPCFGRERNIERNEECVEHSLIVRPVEDRRLGCLPFQQRGGRRGRLSSTGSAVLWASTR